MMHTYGYREWLEEFILIYRSETCLWKVKSKEYQNRRMKDAGYERLAIKLREKEPLADREAVLKKINSLRCTYRKEFRKIMASKSRGDEKYEPKLWYYHLMEFLENQEELKSQVGESDSSAVFSMETEYAAAQENQGNTEEDKHRNAISSTTTKPNTSTSIRSSSLNDIPSTISKVDASMVATSSLQIDPLTSTLRNDTSATTSSSFKRNISEVCPEDSTTNPDTEDNFYDLFGRMISLKFRKISAGQRLLAEKLINEVLFDAQIGQLTIDHRLTNTAVSKNHDDNIRLRSVYNCQMSNQHEFIHDVPFKVEEDVPEDFESVGE